MAMRGLVAGFGFGAGLMYYLDSQLGRRRRALVRDKLTHYMRKADDAMEVASRDFSHRLQGIWAETRSLFETRDVSDGQLLGRIRSKLGRYVSHPGSIQVFVQNGHAIIRGPVLSHEVDQLLTALRKVAGVKAVDDRLEVYKEAGDVPGLQGGRDRPGERSEFFQTNWSPSTRMLAGAAGVYLLGRCMIRPGLVNVALGTIGFGLFTRAMTNRETSLMGTPRGRRSVDFEKTININAPLEQVYQTWSHFENFPRFMKNVQEVRDLGGGRSHWTVAGPLGTLVRWNAVIRRQVTNKILAWRTEPGSEVRHAGIVHFQANPDRTTRVHIRMSYHPPAGTAGHLVASLFAADPKSEMDQDLLRMKSFIETGRSPRDAAVASR